MTLPVLPCIYLFHTFSFILETEKVYTYVFVLKIDRTFGFPKVIGSLVREILELICNENFIQIESICFFLQCPLYLYHIYRKNFIVDLNIF